MPDDGARHHLYLITPHPSQSLDLISCLRSPIILQSLCVAPCPLLLSLISYVHITFSALVFRSLCIFFIQTFFLSSVYVSSLTFVPLILCYLTRILHGTTNRTHSTPSHPPFILRIYMWTFSEKIKTLDRSLQYLALVPLACHILIPFRAVWKFLDIP